MSFNAILNFLKDIGEKYIFTVAGKDIELLLSKLTMKKVNILNLLNEETLFYLAKGYFFATKSVPIILLTQGPGSTSGFPGLGELVYSKIPAIIISIIDSTQNYSIGTYQDSYEIDIVGILKHFSIKSFFVLNKDNLISVLNKAYLLSMFKGDIVWIFIPYNLLNEN